MTEPLSVGEEREAVEKLGVDWNAYIAAKQAKYWRRLKCPKCGSEKTWRRGKKCSHEYVCDDCGYWWCAYYQLMSSKERQLRRKWSEKRKR